MASEAAKRQRVVVEPSFEEDAVFAAAMNALSDPSMKSCQGHAAICTKVPPFEAASEECPPDEEKSKYDTITLSLSPSLSLARWYACHLFSHAAASGAFSTSP